MRQITRQPQTYVSHTSDSSFQTIDDAHTTTSSTHCILRFALACAAFLFLFSSASFAQSAGSWAFVGPAGARDRVAALAADPFNDSVVYLTAPGAGVWKTENSGGAWTPQLDSIMSLQVCSLAIDPRFPNVIYVGTGNDQTPHPGQGVARSTNGGQNWIAPSRFTNKPVCALAVDPTNSSKVLAGSAEGLFLSADSGTTWTRVLPDSVTSIVFDAQGSVYAGLVTGSASDARDNVLARSLDGGSTWSKIQLPPNPNVAGAYVNWVSVISIGGIVCAVVSFQQTPLIPGNVTSSLSPRSVLDFYRSPDSGATWFPTFGIGAARPPVQVVSAAGNLYVAASGLLKSSDQGFTWSSLATATEQFHTAAPTGGGLLLGGEMGLEFAALGGPAVTIAQAPIGRFLGVRSEAPEVIWAAGPGGLSRLSGLTTIVETRPSGVGSVGSVVISLSTTVSVLAVGNAEVFNSVGNATDFSSRSVIPSAELRAPLPPMVADTTNPSSAYIAGRRLYHTNDAGGSWAALPIVDAEESHVVVALAIAPASRLTLYAATACLREVATMTCPTASRMWRSANGGQTWTQMAPIPGLVSRLAVDPRQTNTVYAAMGSFSGGAGISGDFATGDLLRSTNGGGAWTSIRANLPRTSVNAIVIDPDSLPNLAPGGGGAAGGAPGGGIVIIVPGAPGMPGALPPNFPGGQFNQPAQTIYVGTDDGVFVTFNAGSQWTDVSRASTGGLPRTPVTDLWLRSQDKMLLAATFGRGIFQTSTTSLAPGVISSAFSLDISLIRGAIATIGIPLINLSTSNTFDWQLNTLDPWITIEGATGSLRPGSSFQAPIRVSAVNLHDGYHFGRLQLLSGSLAQDILIEAHVTPSPAHITILGGNRVRGAGGAPLPPIRILVTDIQDSPLPNVSVNFAIMSGGGSLSVRTDLTDAEGVATSILTLPQNPGDVQVEITSGNLSATLTAAVVLAPALLTDAVSDGVTFNGYTSFGPGSVLSISGQNLAEETIASQGSSLPFSIQNTQVLLMTPVGPQPLPLFSVSSSKVMALLPSDLRPGQYGIRLATAGRASNDVTISIAAFAPGILTTANNGRGLGIFIKSDGSIVSSTNPADRGSRISFYATGLGAVNPSVPAGQPGAGVEPLNRTVVLPRVHFDFYQAEVIYSGLAPGIPGRYQVTVRVPALISPATNISVSLTMGGFASNRVTIPVR